MSGSTVIPVQESVRQRGFRRVESVSQGEDLLILSPSIQSC